MRGPLYSVFNGKCPKCNLGELYLDRNPYHLSKLAKMHEKCEVCSQKYEPETGFYYGAMYVSYAVSIILMFIPAGLMYFLFDASFVYLLAVILTIYATMYPLIFRWSRNIWLNIFVHYDEELHNSLQKKASGG